MLKSLHIENIAVIEKAEITLGEGLNVLTGETGAGKSIIIDSINCILGQRTYRDIVRDGSDKATVMAEFSDIGEAARQRLLELGYSDDEGTLLLSRTISADGKGSCRINGQPATVSVLAALGTALIDIHGQHDSQSLLNPDTHYKYVDSLAGNGTEIADYEQKFNNYVNLKKELNRLSKAEADKTARLDILKFQVEELTAATLSDGEYESLKSRRDIVRGGAELSAALSAAYAMLKTGEGDVPGAIGAVSGGAALLQKYSRLDPELAPVNERLTSAVFELEAVSDLISARLDALSVSEDELENLEFRLEEISRAMHKYGGSETAALEFLDKTAAELTSIERDNDRLIELTELLDAAGEQLLSSAEALTKSRQEAALIFEQRVCDELSYLDMPGVRFKVDIEKAPLKVTGADRIEFLISANIGSPPKPLSKIASGGELSRTMLAIKSVISAHDEVDTLVFDEIDTGISGRAADKVGRKLKETGKNRQTVCVTHLAQIAAAAEHQYLIEKRTDGETTKTYVTLLDFAGRKSEIARIMGGMNITENTLKSAEDMLSLY